jgi:lipopolysaccharide/colanic/teichoic acid biosynthesis glycosyltransferase
MSEASDATSERDGTVAHDFAVGDSDASFISRPRRPVAEFAGGLPLQWDGPGLPSEPPPSRVRRFQLGLKRVTDFVFAAAGLMLFAPLFLAVAAAIRLNSKGPALFVQPRPGLDGETFQLYKFRTMHIEQADPSGLAQTMAEDGRVTAIGRFLRRTSIDELPQLINVLRGEMSFVGPRPHVVGMRAAGRDYRDLVPYYAYRYRMKPGITGWAQANGLRGPTSDEQLAIERIRYDVAYIQNFSARLDVAILFRTAVREFITGTGV